MASRWLQAKYAKIKAAKRKASLTRPRSFGVDVPKILVNELFNNRSRVRTNITNPASENAGLPILTNTFTQEAPRTEYSLYHRESARGWEPREIDFESLDFTRFVSNYTYRNPLAEEEEIKKAYLEHPKSDVNERKYEEIREEYQRKEKTYLLNTLYRVWQGKWKQGVERYHQVNLKWAGDYRLDLYFSGNEWIFVEETKTSRAISQTYQGHDAAYERFEEYVKNGTGINWIAFHSK